MQLVIRKISNGYIVVPPPTSTLPKNSSPELFIPTAAALFDYQRTLFGEGPAAIPPEPPK